MKTYEQVAQEVFHRRDAYRLRQEKNRKRITAAAISTACICFAAVLGLGLSRFTEPPATANDTISPGILDHFDDAEKGCRIVIQNLDSIPADQNRMDICLSWEDFVPMTWEKLNEYYGIDVIPDLPGDLFVPRDSIDTDGLGIFRRDVGTGEVYFDGNLLSYGETTSRSVHLSVWKERGPVSDLGNFYTLTEKSEIHSVEIAIGKDEQGWFFAEFEHRGVGFRLISTGLSQAETVAVLASLVD